MTSPSSPASGSPDRSYVVGLLGQGIGGSLAAVLQEAEARAQGIPYAYRMIDSDVLDLTLQDTADVIGWATRLGFQGLNVTHPFKPAALAAVDESTSEARLLGAVNTLTIAGGRTLGHNTDWLGFSEALAAEIPECAGGTAAVLGAGGAGVAVAYGALRAGVAKLTIVDVDHGRASAAAASLAAEVGPERVAASTDAPAAIRAASGVIQATPIGMDAHPGTPFDPELLTAEQWLADIIYFPLETELARRARERGCHVMTGGAMAVHQHATAFELFTGRKADVTRMSRHFAEVTGQSVAIQGRAGA